MSQLLQIALSTCPNIEKAKEIGSILVTEKLAACVNIVPVICSIYEWEGKICQDEEVQLIIKFNSKKLKELEARLLSIHPYKIAEFIVLDVSHISPLYLNWALTC